MVEPAHSVSPTAQVPQLIATRAPKPVSAFHRLLSELNPLQYLPVVGTIYRAVTGDTIPETARLAGSAVVSFLFGGPVGLAMNVGATALEKLIGVDPERMGQRLLASVGVGGTAPASADQALSQPEAASEDKPLLAWSPSQLAAYRKPGGEIDADTLNGLELARLHGGGVALVA